MLKPLMLCLATAAWAASAQDEGPQADSRPAPEEAKGVGIVASTAPGGPGLAAQYPGDLGIRSAPGVVFVDDFEVDPAFATWTERKSDAVRLVDDAHGGARACAISVDLRHDSSQWLFKRLPVGKDKVYVRFYVKFPTPSEYLQRFVHLTADLPPKKIPLGGAGVCPDGGARFATEILPHARKGAPAAPGFWRMSSYWCEMSISNDGRYWGNAFEPEAPPVATAGTWTCVEFMVRANTGSYARDGEQAFWIDGREGARFEGLRWRTNPRLAVNGLWLLVHATEAGAKLRGSTQPAEKLTVLFDDLVVADEYIGPRFDAPVETTSPGG
jgi:hypothetical protein